MTNLKKSICKKCDGRGFISIIGESSIGSVPCRECNGTGTVDAPMTNLDVIRQMTPVQLTKFIFMMAADSTNEVWNRDAQKWQTALEFIEWLDMDYSNGERREGERE